MNISKNKVVLLAYELKLNSGETVDMADAQHPFAFIHGIGQTLPAFDYQLEGMKKGDSFAFSLSCEDGYGQPDQANIATIPKEVFEGIPDNELTIGAELPMSDGQGNQFYGVVTEIQPQFVIMDFNHPLVGQDLNFSGTVLEVREASTEELSHGHAHGVGGHHH